MNATLKRTLKRYLLPFTGSMRLLRAHPILMNGQWYLENNPDVARAEIDPIEHFHRIGWKEGRNPSEHFDVTYYLTAYPDIRAAEINPLIHYLQVGCTEGRNPSPTFDAAAYLRDHPDLSQKKLTAYEQFLVATGRADVEREPMTIPRGAYDEISESGLLHETWYRGKYPDVVAVPDPLRHYIDWGIREGRSPNPYFDPTWYTKEHRYALRGLPPILHYLRHGWQNGCDPSAAFSLTHYSNLTGWSPRDGEPIARFMKEGLPQAPALRPVDPAKPGHRINLGRRDAHCCKGSFLRYPLDHRPAETADAHGSFIPNRLVLHWVIPDFGTGGGGHMTIFRMVRALGLRGHRQTVWIHNRDPKEPLDGAYDDVVRHYQTIDADIRLIDEEGFVDAQGDAVIATDWASVWPARSMQQVKRCFYFVQDYEPFFFARGAEALLAETTYRSDVDCLCASPWLSQTLEENFGRWTRHFHLAADRDVYYPASPRSAPAANADALPRIALYARRFTARRAVDLGLLALEVLARRGHGFIVDFFGSEEPIETAPFPFVQHGTLPPQELSRLYRSATIGVVFSATNYSLVPQEMMACGLPVVELDVESTKAIYPEGVVSRAGANPDALADAIEALLFDGERRATQARKALNWVSQFSWEGAADVIEKGIVDRLQELGHARLAPAVPRATPKASVVIPTLNGGPLLLDVIERVKAQKLHEPFEILVIDSGSSDGTMERIEADDSVMLHRIDKSEFGHGRTRNLGVELTSGDYIAFLTQDALPTNEGWLANLVMMLDHYPDAAGAFGHHLAWEAASAFTKRDIDQHFRQFFEMPLAVSKDLDPARYAAGDIQWRQQLHYYSDNNSCLRRSVWEKIPYRDVPFGEDQLYAEDIVAAGYQKVFAPNAVVYHSHDYDEAETEERSMIEARFFYEHFGYVLMEDAATLEKTLAALNAADTAWGRTHGIGDEEIAYRHKLNKARLKGYLAGGPEAQGHLERWRRKKVA
ncbi:glycosyltransferase [Afifella sp. H1R]|uniref:rhamnosyltransferase WsaF family glycosyltransferase n=1 Tax=Afifella sp. H1R TaxID=2908841 RepID=UPI001F29AD97|nr:glycosyltransferase [Afifella sp. H1R]